MEIHRCVIDYVWIDGDNNLRSKVRTVAPEYFFPQNICYKIQKNINTDLSDNEFLRVHLQWSYDGSSTGQAKGDNSEIIIVPVYICNDAFSNHKYSSTEHYIAFCQSYDHKMTPLDNNHYAAIDASFIHDASLVKSCFGFEQEFFVMQKEQENITKISNNPVGMPFMSDSRYCNHQNSQQYYCGVGSENAPQNIRHFVEEVYHYGLMSGLTLSGMNAEVAIGQWEIQVGPIYGIVACHQLWVLRYLLKKIAEKYDYCVSFHPKPLNKWNGSGLHTNYSDKSMRCNNSYYYITEYVARLAKTHADAMKKYGTDNHLRMTGNYETSNYDTFSCGVASRSASVRIPRTVYLNQCGYIEDRRPASNADPYLIFGIHVPASLSLHNNIDG